jgi:molecular chaperone GrpE
MQSSRATDHVAETADQAAPQEQPPDHGEELARLEDRLKRAVADLDNYRKRTAREVERRVEESQERLLSEWLEVVDSVDRALRMQEPDSPAHAGLRAVLDQMEAILARSGARRIGEPGERFDPERHDAVAVRPGSDVEQPTVVEVARSGWEIGDRVLRPAQVVVASRAEPPA